MYYDLISVQSIQMNKRLNYSNIPNILNYTIFDTPPSIPPLNLMVNDLHINLEIAKFYPVSRKTPSFMAEI